MNHLGEEHFIAEIEHGTLIGYKFFDLPENACVKVSVRLETEENLPKNDCPARTDERCADTGADRVNYAPETVPAESLFEIRLSETGESVGRIELNDLSEEWKEFRTVLRNASGVFPLYFVYHGKDKVQLKSIGFEGAE